jgi:hypothetical protein
VTRVAGFCRKHEGGLGEIKLACDLLHLFLCEPLGLRQNGQLIPAKASLRKHVADVVSVFHEIWLQTLRVVGSSRRKICGAVGEKL